ncbi:regulatory protein GemA, partial [Leptospira sp. SA-E8]|uniref:regulatory protein GemA n=1 Tax=Leptospira sp. SA-E8 TaxID=3422259 RepID=UPI003EBEF246
RELGAIHMGAKSLGWSDDDYRFHLRQQTGMRSAADLDAAGRRKMLAHLAACGFTPKAAPSRPFDQVAKIQWLWRKLKTAGVLRDGSEIALLSFIDRTTGLVISDVRFLPPQEASKVIEALKAWLDRVPRGAA